MLSARGGSSSHALGEPVAARVERRSLCVRRRGSAQRSEGNALTYVPPPERTRRTAPADRAPQHVSTPGADRRGCLYSAAVVLIVLVAVIAGAVLVGRNGHKPSGKAS